LQSSSYKRRKLALSFQHQLFLTTIQASASAYLVYQSSTATDIHIQVALKRDASPLDGRFSFRFDKIIHRFRKSGRKQQRKSILCKNCYWMSKISKLEIGSNVLFKVHDAKLIVNVRKMEYETIELTRIETITMYRMQRELILYR